MLRRRTPRNLLSGAAAGLIAGFAASWAMNLFMAGVARLVTGGDHGNDPQRRKFAIAEATRAWQERADPTGEAADAVANFVLGRHLSASERKLAGPAVHYVFGSAAGAAYGAFAEDTPSITAGYGLAFAMALLVFGEEIGNPVFGLTPPPNGMPWTSHVSMFASHIVYGLTLEGVRRAVKAAA